MGGNPGAMGNGLGFGLQLPHTTHVPDLKNFLKKVRGSEIFRQIPGRRDLRELLATMFRDEYSNPDDLERVVSESLKRMRAGFVPVKIVEQQRYDQRYNEVAACK